MLRPGLGVYVAIPTVRGRCPLRLSCNLLCRTSMDERLRKRFEILQSLLTEARDDLDLPTTRPSWVDERLASFAEFMDHREFELALDVLQDVGGEFDCSATFWRRLKQASDVMGLDDRRNYLRGEYRKALKREGAA